MRAPLAGVLALALSCPAAGQTPAAAESLVIMPGFDDASVVETRIPVVSSQVLAEDPDGELVSGGDAAPPLVVAASAPPKAQTAGATASRKAPGKPDPVAGPSRRDKPPRLALSGKRLRQISGQDELAEPSASLAPASTPAMAAGPAAAHLPDHPPPFSPAALVMDDGLAEGGTTAPLPATAAPAQPAPTLLRMAVSDPVWAQPAEPADAGVPALTQAPPVNMPAQNVALAGGEKAPVPAAAPGLAYPWAPPAPPPPPPAPVVETPEVDPQKLAGIDASPEVRAATIAVAAAPNLAVEFLPSTANTESLREAIVAALKGNPEIQIALARQDFARYGVHQANAGLFPKLDLNMAIGGELNTPNAGDPTRLVRKEGSLTLNQNVFDFGYTFNDIKRARADYRSAQWGTRERIETIAYDITTAYLTVLQQQKLVALTQEKIASADKILKMVEIQNGLGLNTAADVGRAKAKLENVQAELLDRQSALQQAREAYRRLTRRLPMTAVDLPSPGDALPPSAEAAVDMIDTRNPRLAQAMEDRRSLDRQRAAQTGNLFPRFSLTAQGNWKDDVAGATGVNKDARAMITMSYSFLNSGAEVAIRKRIEAKLREAEYEIDRRRREVEQDIRIDFTALQAARAKIDTINNEIASAQKVDELYRQQFREGRRSVFDLLDSQQILFDAKANQITNMTAKQLAEFRVLQRLGGLFDLVSQGEPLPDIATRAPGTER